MKNESKIKVVDIDAAAVIFDSGECPRCGSGQIFVNGTKRPYRYIICTDCGLSWKAIMVNLVCEDALQKAAEIYSLKKKLRKIAGFF